VRNVVCVWLLRNFNATGQVSDAKADGSDRAGRPTNGLPELQEVSRGVWRLGKILVNKAAKAIEFPAVVNLREGIAEYFLVHKSGKIHESVFRTDVEPYQIHVAMLLIGAQGAGTNAFPESEQAGPIPGNPVRIEIGWKEGKREKLLSAEEFVRDVSKGAAMEKGTWTYNGARQFQNVFTAQETGSIVSCITDPDTLINNPRRRRDDDDNWVSNTRKVPPDGTLVRVVIKLDVEPSRR